MIRTALLPMLLLPIGTLAQVSVNRGALDQLQPSAPAASARPPAAHPQAARTTPTPAARPASRPTRPSPPAPAAKPKPKPRPVAVAPAPPPAAVLPPTAELPKPAATPPPPVPMVADAVGEVTAINAGVRITFGSGKADLNQATVNGITAVARQVRADPSIDLNVFAYAAGVPDDPSTPRRLSLSRALAARAVLIAEGIVSTRIYVRALGAAPTDGPPDRVDVVRAGVSAPDAKP